MNTKTMLLAVLAAVVATVIVVVAMGAGDHGSDSTKGNATDIAFINDMTTHHEGAIGMAKLARTRAEHPEIRRMADDIVTAQQAEIDHFERMAGEMRSMHDDGTHRSHMGMTDADMGMDMDMDALEMAKPFDKAFIDAMIPHHQGAIAMARQLLAKGDDPQLRDIGRAIIDAQGKEIVQMQMWHKQWYGSAGSSMGMGG